VGLLPPLSWDHFVRSTRLEEVSVEYQRWILSLMPLGGSTFSMNGHTYASPSLFEDDHGMRTLALRREPAGFLIPVHLWVRAFTDTPTIIAFTDDTAWYGITVQQWLDERTENRVDATYAIAPEKLRRFDYLPSFKDFVLLGKESIAPKSSFVHLHSHSEFSALDGYSHVSEMVAEAVRNNQPALALTDHGVCSGHPALQIEAKKAGIKPVYGIESYFVDDRFFRPMRKPAKTQFKDEDEYQRLIRQWEEEQKRGKDYWHLVLWAQTEEGLRNLWAASSEAQREGKYRGKPQMDWSTLERHAEGLMVSTACLRGPLSAALLNENHELANQRLGRLIDIFGGRVHLEIHTNQMPEQKLLNERLITMARDFSLPVVAVSDSHYPTAEHKLCHKVWIAVQTDSDLQDDADLFAGDEDYHLLSEQEARHSLSYLPPAVVDEAISNTSLVAEQCDATIRSRGSAPVFSKRPTREESQRRDVERLTEICLNNWHKTVGKKFPQEIYEERFAREMKLLVNKDFCGYFLMVSNYCRHARDNGVLVGPGRGSGGGCLVAYLANITEIDPVEAELIFERFLTSGRKGLPDFDVDFPSSMREWLTNFIIDYHGEDHVVRVGTHTYLRNKGAVRSLAKVLGSTIQIHFPDIEMICAIIDEAEADSAGLGRAWDEVWTAFPQEYEQWSSKYPLLFEMAEKIVGRLSTYGQHPAGVVIATDAPLKGEVPMRYTPSGHAVSEWNMEALESIGLVKFDLLTIRNLDTLQEGVDIDSRLAQEAASFGARVAEETGERIDFYSWTAEYDDPEVWDAICAGDTLGMFQIETYAGTAMCRRYKPRSIQELADVITLIRPGPMRSGLTDTFLRRRHGEEEVTFPHPLLEQVLSKRYGTIIYQEDILSVCMILAKYDENEADEVRKILGKKKVEEAKEAGLKFVHRCEENGVPRSVSEPLWEQMEEFAKYSFGNAHAFGYATIAFWCVSGATKIYDWDNKEYISVSKAFKRGVDHVACFDEETGKTIRGKVKKVIRTNDLHSKTMGWVVRTKSNKRLECSIDHRILTPDGYKKVSELLPGDMVASEKRVSVMTDERRRAIAEGVRRHWEGMSQDDKRLRIERTKESLPTELRSTAAKLGWSRMDSDERESRVKKLVESATGGTWGACRRGVVEKCGHRYASSNERFICEWFNLHGIDHESQVWVGSGFADWRVKGVFIEFDGLDRHESYFENKFGDDPYIVIKDINYVDHDLHFFLEEDIMRSGGFVTFEPIVSITPSKPIIMYDIVMEQAPHNFLADGIVVHNCAWLKVRKPLAFLTAVLSTADAKRIPDFIEEARQRGITPLPPDINTSDRRFSVVRR